MLSTAAAEQVSSQEFPLLPVFIGFANADNQFMPIFLRGTKCDSSQCKRILRKELLPAGNGNNSNKLKIFQGECILASNNAALCSVKIPERINDKIVESVTFRLDQCKLLKIFANVEGQAEGMDGEELVPEEVKQLISIEDPNTRNYFLDWQKSHIEDTHTLSRNRLQNSSRAKVGKEELKKLKKAVGKAIQKMTPDRDKRKAGKELQDILKCPDQEQQTTKLKHFIRKINSPLTFLIKDEQKNQQQQPDGWIGEAKRIETELFQYLEKRTLRPFGASVIQWKCPIRILSGFRHQKLVWYCIQLNAEASTNKNNMNGAATTITFEFDQLISQNKLIMINLADYGKILYADWGNRPSFEMRAKIKKEFITELSVQDVLMKLDDEVCEDDLNELHLAIRKKDCEQILKLLEDENSAEELNTTTKIKIGALTMHFLPFALAIWMGIEDECVLDKLLYTRTQSLTKFTNRDGKEGHFYTVHLACMRHPENLRLLHYFKSRDTSQLYILHDDGSSWPFNMVLSGRWRILLIYGNKIKEYENIVKAQRSFNMDDYGIFLKCGYGKNPPKDIMDYYRKKYAVHFDLNAFDSEGRTAIDYLIDINCFNNYLLTGLVTCGFGSLRTQFDEIIRTVAKTHHVDIIDFYHMLKLWDSSTNKNNKKKISKYMLINKISAEKNIMEAIMELIQRTVQYEIHFGIICDECEKQKTEKGSSNENIGFIVGLRFNCIECEDFDLCRECFDKGLHKQHRMKQINRTRPESYRDLDY